ncbi:unnamed protein product [Rhodiola kirilowii]
MVLNFSHTISSQKRQALVAYLEKNNSGITVYGFMLDRTQCTASHNFRNLTQSSSMVLLNKTIDDRLHKFSCLGSIDDSIGTYGGSWDYSMFLMELYIDLIAI